MKLRNILIALFAVCALTACSKDDAVTKNDSGETVEALISFAVSSEPVTKMFLENGYVQEKYIDKLTAYIFKGSDKTFVTSKTVTADDNGGKSVEQIEKIVVKVRQNSNDQFIAVFIANATPTKEINTLNDLMTSTLARGKDEYLPMVSKQIQFANLQIGENWIDNNGQVVSSTTQGKYTAIDLTRLVARIEIEKLDVQSLQDKFPNAAFKLETISLVNVNSATIPDKDNNTVGGYLRGLDDETFDNCTDLEWIKSPSSFDDYLLTTYTKEKYMIPTQASGNSSENNFIFPDSGEEYNSAIHDGPRFVKYIYSSPESSNTALLLSGKFKRDKNSTKEETRYYRVYLNDNINAPGAIESNKIYLVTIFIGGEGSPKPDPVLETIGVSIQLKVKPWEVYVQDEEITN